MKRLEDWPKRLHIYFESMRDVPFEFGANDCGRFACGAIKSMTGVDLSLAAYSTPREEETALKALAVQYKFPKVSVKRAQRGDIAIYIGKNGPTCLVVSMDGIGCLGPGENGIMSIPISECVEAWHIG